MVVRDYRALYGSLYAVALSLVLSALLDLFMTVIPLEPWSVSWRFGAVGFGVQAMTSVLLGLVLSVGAATLLEQLRVMRALSVVALGGSVVVLGVMMFFGLDFLQLRQSVVPQVRPKIDIVALKVMVQGLMGAVVLALAGLSVFRFARKTAWDARDGGAAARKGGLLVGMQAKQSTGEST